MSLRLTMLASLLFLKPLLLFSQDSLTTILSSSHKYGSVDLHCHATLKNYVNKLSSSYDVVRLYGYPMHIDTSLMWQAQRCTKDNRIKKGSPAHFKAYNQADYSRISKSDYGILVNSLCEIEKFTVRKNSYVFILQWFVAHIKRKRVKTFSQSTNSAWTDFNVEYYLSVNQQRSVNGSKQIIPVKNTTDILHNERIGATSLINSIEGGHVLFGNFFSDRRYLWKYDLSAEKNISILPDPEAGTLGKRTRLFYLDKKHQQELQYVTTYREDYEGIKKELFRNIDSLKRFEYPLLYAGLAHHDWNQLCGYGWSKDQEGFTRSLLSWWYSWHIIAHNYWYKGMTPLGQRTALKLLAVNDNDYKVISNEKPILIDVKHMGLRSRVDYYKMIKTLNDSNKLRIPIICSHTGVAGLDYKSLLMKDRTQQLNLSAHDLDSLLTEFRKHIYTSRRQDYKTLNSKRKLITDVDSAHKQYAGWFFPWQMSLYDEDIEMIMYSRGLIGIMAEQRTLKSGSNYFRKKCVVSYDRRWRSFADKKGLVAFRADTIPHIEKNKYEKATKQLMRKFYREKARDIPIPAKYKQLFFDPELLSQGRFEINEYTLNHLYTVEPFVRNVFYVIEKANLRDTTEAWNHVCFGSDFDGNIDPIDAFPIADSMEYFQNLIRLFMPYFVQQVASYQVPMKKRCLITFRSRDFRYISNNPYDKYITNMRVKEKLLLKIDKKNVLDNGTVLQSGYMNLLNKATDNFLQKIFSTNARDFILKYYGKTWDEIKQPLSN